MKASSSEGTGAKVRAGIETDAEYISRVHFEAVVQTAAAFYPSEVIQSWTHAPDEARREQFRQAIAGKDELFVVADHDLGLVGFGSIRVSSQELRAVYVHPRVGRCGIGGIIVRELERLARAHGIVALHLESSVNAERFYLRHGYQVVERSTRGLGNGSVMACVKMKKSILP